jgi:hypothetical protein
MGFNSQSIFANLAEKERLKGHHTPEGRAIRTLSRAMNGWSAGNLSAVDVLVLCGQAMEDWLKARLEVPAWSPITLPALLDKAVEQGLLKRLDASRVRRIHDSRSRLRGRGGTVGAHEVQTALEFCIQIVEEHW